MRRVPDLSNQRFIANQTSAWAAEVPRGLTDLGFVNRKELALLIHFPLQRPLAPLYIANKGLKPEIPAALDF